VVRKKAPSYWIWGKKKTEAFYPGVFREKITNEGFCFPNLFLGSSPGGIVFFAGPFDLRNWADSAVYGNVTCGEFFLWILINGNREIPLLSGPRFLGHPRGTFSSTSLHLPFWAILLPISAFEDGEPWGVSGFCAPAGRASSLGHDQGVCSGPRAPSICRPAVHWGDFSVIAFNTGGPLVARCVLWRSRKFWEGFRPCGGPF